jgi:hypothetical protein
VSKVHHGFRWRKNTVSDTTPEPGGVDGQVVEYRYVNLTRDPLPYVPMYWGQGFPTVFSDVPMLNGGKWPNLFLPDFNFVVPSSVRPFDHLWPITFGSAGTFEKQMVGHGAPPIQTGQATAHLVNAAGAARAQLPPAPVAVWAGSFART